MFKRCGCMVYNCKVRSLQLTTNRPHESLFYISEMDPDQLSGQGLLFRRSKLLGPMRNERADKSKIARLNILKE